MKKTLCAIVLLALLASPVFAQGPFTDVPTDHWAYQAVDQLAKDGIIIGYPDGTFGGKRAMTRYEFAQALARAIPVILGQIPPPTTTAAPAGVSQADFDALKAQVNAIPKPEVTKADLALIQKMVDEFKDELTAMGVDLDALKRDVADLNKRVTALEDEGKRLKITGLLNIAVIGEKTREVDADAPPVTDRDEREFHGDDNLLENITLLRQLDLAIDANAGSAKVHALLNIGNYLPYLETISDYTGSDRPTNVDNGFYGSTDQDGDQFFPYYMYADIPLGSSSLSVGRMPVQWSPYTLKMIDVDSYIVDPKTDSGDYPLDGIKLTTKFSSVGLQLFASKVDTNGALTYWNDFPGLVSQAHAGLYEVFGAFNDQGDAGFGGLTNISQVAGARLSIDVGAKAKLTGSYLRASEDGTADQAQLLGAGLNAELGKIMVNAEWAQTKLTENSTLDDHNEAIDGSLGMNVGKLGVKAGWKSIGYNFTAPGFWDKLGRWTNPTNIEGPYANLNLGLGSNLSLLAGAEFLSGKDTVVGLPAEIDNTNDDIRYYTAGLKWGMSSSTSVDLGLEWVKWQPNGATDTDEKYITIGLGHQFGSNVTAKVGYQIIDFNTNADGHTYSDTDYKGDLAVAQFMVKF